ncbi:hypothetical protein [Streptomyces sp. NPDC048508]|uniref:hypothetical protein n=1 Tax=Streptomyces sp. NPDC048508 TaxID=3365561 RepID=UPI0037112D93
MNAPRIHDALGGLTASTLTMSGAAPRVVITVSLWVLIAALPRLLPALSAHRRDAMWTRIESQAFQEVDTAARLRHIETGRRDAASAAGPVPVRRDDDVSPPESPP